MLQCFEHSAAALDFSLAIQPLSNRSLIIALTIEQQYSRARCICSYRYQCVDITLAELLKQDGLVYLANPGVLDRDHTTERREHIDLQAWR